MRKVLSCVAAMVAFWSVGNAATLDFSSSPSGNSGLSTFDAGDATIDIVNGTTVFVYQPGDFGAFPGSGGVCALGGTGCLGDWTLTFDYAVTNLAFEADFFDAGDSVEVSYYNGATLLGSIMVGANGVFNLGSAVITSLFFDDSSSAGEGFGFGEFSFDRTTGGVSDVPVPAALPLFLAGLGAGAFFRKRRKAA